MLPAIFNTIYMTLLSLVVARCAGHLLGHLPDRIRPARKQAGQGGAPDHGDVAGHPRPSSTACSATCFFLVQLQWGYSLLAGAMTLAIMILPLIMRTTEEAVLSVPDGYREGSFAPRRGPAAHHFPHRAAHGHPGILAGVILAIGRIVGETAALIYTAGTYAQTADSLFSPGAHAVGTHVCALQRGVAHRSGLRHGGGAADRGGRHQRPVCGRGPRAL